MVFENNYTMKLPRIAIVPALILSVSLPARAITYSETDSIITWTLDDCISRAMDKSLVLESKRLDISDKQVSVSESKWAFAPDVTAGSNYNISIGRVLDETTYDFVTNETVGSSSTSISGSITIFNGLRSIRSFQYARLDKQAAELGLLQAEDELEIGVTAGFLETLCAMENIKNCQAIITSINEQLRSASERVSVGKATGSELLQIQSQLADAENRLLTAWHDYDMARLDLCQLLEIEDFKSFTPDGRDYITTLGNDTNINYSVLIANASQLPSVKIAAKNVELARKSMQMTRSAWCPSIVLSAGYGTSFSNARQKIMAGDNGQLTYDAYPFREQYSDNASYYLSIGINIPIFDRLATRSQVRHAAITHSQSLIQLQTATKQARKEVMQIIMDVETAWQQYQGAKAYLSSATEAARQISLKYEAGAASATDYNTAISTLIDAQIKNLTGKYEYALKLKILEVYKNRCL